VPKSPPENETGPTRERAWHSPLLLAVLRLTAAIGTVWLGAVFVTTPELILKPFGLFEIALAIAVWTTSLPRFSDAARFAMISALYFGTSVAAVLYYGTPPGLPVLLGLFVLVTTFAYDWKGGCVAAAASLLLIAAGAWGWTSGVLPLDPTIPKLQPSSFQLWMRTMFAEIMGLSGIILIVAHVLKEMRVVVTRLRLAEEKFSRAFRVSPDAMIITELATGRFLEVNDGHAALTGYARDEVVGRTSIDIGTFRSTEERDKFAVPLRESGSLRNFELEIVNRAGTPIDVLCSAECFDLNGKRYAVTTIRDVGERKRIEAALKANEERFRSFVENASVGIYRSTPDGRIVMVNPALLKITGYTSFEDLAARNLETGSYEPNYSRRDFRERVEREGVLKGWEAEWKTRDGSTIFVRESTTVIRGPDGGVLYYDGIIEDITERKRAEQALRESEERFRNLTEAAFEAIVITEAGRILDINDQGVKMFGYDRPEIVGRAAIEFVSPEWRQTVADAIRDGREAEYEHKMLRKDGSQIHVEARAKMAHTGGRLLRMTALRDVSERHEAEQRRKSLEEQLRQTHKMEALGTLAGGIAHDFNNILTVITCNTELLKIKLQGDSEVNEHLDAVAQAGVRAAGLVRQILTFSREEVTQRKALQLAPVVAEAMKFLRSTIPSTIDIKIDLGTDAPAVLADATQVHQVVMNLGTNAWHAMKDRPGRLEVRLEAFDVDLDLAGRVPNLRVGRFARLTMSDSGKGMDQATISRIFEPFFTTKAVGEGTGLGLSVVHGIMQNHEGAIAVFSEPGEGTTFQLYFPAHTSAESVAEVRKPSVPLGNGESILLVDDEAPIALLGKNILQRLNYTVEAHTNVLEALESVRAAPERYDIVILDQTMPVMTGIDLAGRIGKIRPDLPIILTTGYAGQLKIEQLRAKGICELLLKPSTIQSLGGLVHRVLSERVSK
jgi:PAS domain S-box-containing protein